MPEVYVIHSGTDDTYANRLHEAFAAAEVDAWVDHLDCEGPREEWEAQNQEALASCQCGLFILSAQSAASAQCHTQCQTMLDAGKRLYIASVEQAQFDAFPEPNYNVQYLDLTRDFESGTAQIVQAIKNQYNPESAPVPGVPDGTITGPFQRWHLNLPLIGRDADLSAVQKSLADGSRVTAILGLSGVGKSRLAAEVVNTTLFRHGVIWHNIGPYTTVADLTMLIRNHLGIDLTCEADAVWAALGKRQVLLVLDDAEQCMQQRPYAERLNMLDLSGGTRVLMTSRQRWPDLRDVKYHDLKTPDPNVAGTIVRAMIKRQPPAYSLRGLEDEIAQAARYRPKLIWYALRWADDYPPEYVLEILKTMRGSDAEEACDDLVHRTIRLVEQRPEWPAALAALRRLAVCRGGFTFEAARALIDDPSALRLLKQWGLVTLDNTRYSIDPLLLTTLEVDCSACEPHFNYFLAHAEQCDLKQDFHMLDADSGNLVAAFDWAIGENRLADALKLANACSQFMAAHGRYDPRRIWYERIAARLPNRLPDEPQDDFQASLHVGLGIAYLERPTNDRRTNVHRALTAFERALHFYTASRYPANYAMLQNNLGITYRALAEHENRAANLRQAIACYERAARYYTPSSSPLDFAAVQTNLGNAYFDLSRLENRRDNLWQANAAFRRALAFFKQEIAPLSYAITQGNLGAVYADLADVDASEKREDNLKKAIGAFERALRFFTPQRAPMHYARTLNNLGTAYRNLAELHGEPDNLRGAIKVYNVALRHWTLSKTPQQFAITQTNLARAYLTLADMEEDRAHLQRAAEALEQTFYYYTPRINAFDYMKARVLLGITHKKLGNTQKAVECWREAEQYFRTVGMADMADRMQRWIEGRSDPGASRSDSKWLWQTRL